MVTELTLFDDYEIVSHVKKNDPSTSLEAARVAVKSFTGHKQKVLQIFDRATRGLIDEELETIAQQQGLRPGAASKRRSDLSKDGRLVWGGEYRLTSTRCKAKVWHKNYTNVRV